jgi:solute carrier family 25 (mitochondrial carnitine/acylcarnitine transporter), member 20/29
MAGGLAGLTNSVISGPIEHVRIRLQTQPSGELRLYTGPADCLRKITSYEGITGLYRGQVVTLLREFHGYGIWFAAFEALMGLDTQRNKISREEIPSWKVALYGGLAGEALWLGSHPLDVIKSKMQSDGFGDEKRYKTMTGCFQQTYMNEGIRGLWRGIGPALLRAMPVSAGTFAT